MSDKPAALLLTAAQADLIEAAISAGCRIRIVIEEPPPATGPGSRSKAWRPYLAFRRLTYTRGRGRTTLTSLP